jgi:hypothetical protein
MIGKQYSFEQQIKELREREKELKCIYRVEEVLNKKLPIDDFFSELLKRIPNGWQYPEACRVKITFEDRKYKEANWEETTWVQSAPIVIDDHAAGKIEVFYTMPRKMIIDSPFLPQEQKLLNTIAKRIGDYLFDLRLENSIRLLQEEKHSDEKDQGNILTGSYSIHWQWRKEISKVIAEKLDFEKFAIKGFYLIGSTKTAEAGPGSDIDLLIHIEGQSPSPELIAWFEGWSFCLSEMNFEKTGYKSNGLLDVHYITDDDIKQKTSYAVMIGSLYNRALPVKVIKE